ncbi:hypothetical protein HMPREF0549_1775 [Limosilactobacillus vaginalis DSM 5837 = ATCC 49540]|uniref:Uncharacterized protein n=2 Tax=Limosilactobacillus vaginalis TaxID=1633 RepID=C2EWD9_9LACO|nr:hypothetical protein HMPREF0549_1775 [Limosilactobacillus vaginalis DSM 5837 = ATCC 49540]
MEGNVNYLDFITKKNNDQILIALGNKFIPQEVSDEMKEENERLDRLSAEREELAKKITKLKTFMKSDTYKQLDDFDKTILQEQKHSMKSYKRALDLRLKWTIY